ncbi:sulfite exporter TauE/SafE family protein [Aeromicrobium alkaliterrae]|uniref:Probable membrane transporter protein n=1 Tax=Aeromicrobium alkaliterrae TaxID=302168 RepID=A0ABN2K1V8_9ACTN
MSPVEIIAIVLAGVAAGTINTVVGSGTLITFPTLLAIGVPPVTANVSNTIGLVPGSVSGAIGYRAELAGQKRRALWLIPASAIGAIAGAVLLLVLPSEAFSAIVPVLIVLGCVLVVVGPRISAAVARRHADRGGLPDRGAWWTQPLVGLTGVYGGYFGAAQGIILLAVMGIGIDDELQRLNALKNVLAGVANGVSGLLFVVVADVDWLIVLLIAIGSTVGGQIGSRYGRRLPATALRVFIVAVGLVALAVFLAG